MEGTDDGTNQKTTERDGMDGKCHRTPGKDREQAGMSREGRRMMEKVLENTVHDSLPYYLLPAFSCPLLYIRL